MSQWETKGCICVCVCVRAQMKVWEISWEAKPSTEESSVFSVHPSGISDIGEKYACPFCVFVNRIATFTERTRSPEMIYKSALSGKEERKAETEWQKGRKQEESQRFPPIDPGGSVRKPEGLPNEGRPTAANCMPVMWPTNHM